MTKAEEIAEQFGNDYRVDSNPKGENIQQVCEHERVTAETSQELELVRYIFADNSCITISPNGGWSIGYLDCWCWQGEGHVCDKKTGWCHGCGDEYLISEMTHGDGEWYCDKCAVPRTEED